MSRLKQRTPINKAKFLWIFLSFIAFAIFSYFFYASFNKEKKVLPPNIQTVVTTPVVSRDYPVIIETSGNIVSANIVDIRPQVANVIAKIHIQEGQEVKQGDLLFTLDDRANKANFEKFKALADDSERQYQRALELSKQNFISKASVDTAMANANSARSAANAAEVAMSYDYIRSPISGRAGVINVFPGSLVSPSNIVSTSTSTTATSSQTAMVTISQQNPIHVQFTVPEAFMASLIQLQKASKGLVVNVDIGGGVIKKGKVYVIDNQIDPILGSVRVKAIIDNADQALAPGRFVQVNLQTQIYKDALVVPIQAIVTNTQGTSIYTVDSENKTVFNRIKVVHQNNGFAAITGLKEGDRIVVEGKQNIRPGIKIAEAATAKSTENIKK